MRIGTHVKFIWYNHHYLDGLVSICDEGDEETEHHVDEEGDERVEIGSAEQPHHCVLLLKVRKRREHVVPVD